MKKVAIGVHKPPSLVNDSDSTTLIADRPLYYEQINPFIFFLYVVIMK